MTRSTRALALPLIAVLATTTSIAVGAPSMPSGGTAPLGDAIAGGITAMLTQQSIYIPCYAFVPLTPDLRDDWRMGRKSCYLLKDNTTLNLAAPVHIPATNGKLRIKKLRCYANSGTAGDRIEYTAYLDGNGTLAKMTVVQKREEAPESSAAATPGMTLDPLTQHYDLSISWRVVVAEGDGWLPKDNEFRGCRVDYVIQNI